MKIIYIFFIVFTFYSTLGFSQQTKKYKINTIAFYNLENLYDTEDDATIYDESSPIMEMTESLRKEVYKKKLFNMAKVISEIGKEMTATTPALVGVSEIENRKVLEDLVNQEPLLQKDYGIVHFDSPDRRGIDVALLYQKKLFIPTHYKAHPLMIYQDNDKTKRIYTRDQLVVSGMLDGEKIHVIVNHWPSRSGGEARSRPKRIKAAKLNKRIIDSIFSEDPYAKIITMGDLNDDPTSPSVKDVLKAKENREDVKLKELYNPMEEMYNKGIGTLA
ncbi:MAG TPA: endonuclease, partial [Flavobacteriaceae bacterium]|nr:endonuclease [Flavobacteriaceae bacterium]